MICDNCKNKEVCKYKEKAKNGDDYLNNLVSQSCLSIEIKCKERRKENAQI